MPFCFLSPDVAISIGKTLGDVQRMDEQFEMIKANFLRVGVAVDISQPLCRKRKISLEDGSEEWISLSTNTSQIYAIGVGGLLMMIRIVFSGYEVKAL